MPRPLIESDIGSFRSGVDYDSEAFRSGMRAGLVGAECTPPAGAGLHSYVEGWLMGYCEWEALWDEDA